MQFTDPELRNRTHAFIMENIPEARIWLAHRLKRPWHKTAAAKPWKATRAYIGLTQACQILRKEFLPLYFNALHYSTNPNSLGRFMNDFNFTDLRKEIYGIVSTLLYKPLPSRGVDVLPLIKTPRGSAVSSTQVSGPGAYRYERSRLWNRLPS